ncbi:hypothetical protein HFP15_32005 [Amycolatopsis sp. K13G38]|uniref:DUF4190 domain-containing protein n=1 Tax=Amycolatopsis acididurans TaxID=2724524 RepID=A0ABX1JCL3_9PSEU|nr:hypothetical protein [Amycolatopsis acididurans]NKQ57498.1 hypothetical protein [Amycolatopsis acididurans]
MTEAETDKLELPAEPSRGGRLWRGFTGSLAAGLTLLAVVVLGAALVCAFRQVPGPGLASLIGHPIAAVLALGAQRVADTKRGKVAAAAGVVVCVAVVVALWLFWWD